MSLRIPSRFSSGTSQSSNTSSQVFEPRMPSLSSFWAVEKPAKPFSIRKALSVAAEKAPFMTLKGCGAFRCPFGGEGKARLFETQLSGFDLFVDLNDVKTFGSFNDLARHADRKIEHNRIEWGRQIAATDRSELAAVLVGTRVVRNFLGDF